MFKFISFIIIVFLFTIFYLALYNMNTVKLMITNEFYYELPQIALIMASITTGAAFMFLVFVVRDTRHYIKEKKLQKRRRKDEIVEQYYSRAIHNLIGKHTDEALEDFELALRENAEHIPSLIKTGDIYYEKSDNIKSVEYYQKVLKSDDQNIEALCRLADIMMRMKKDAEALEYCERVLGLEQDNLTALYKKREIYETQTDWEQVIQTQRQIINAIANAAELEKEKDKLLGYRYENGKQSLENGDIETAKKEFKEIIKIQEDFIPAHLGIAEVMLKEEAIEEAVTYLEKARERTKSPIILARLEDLLITIGEPSRLLKIYRTAITEDMASDTLRLFQGKLYYRLEMLDDAMDTLKGFDTGVFYPELHMLRGGIYLKRGELERAVEEFLRLIDIKKALWIPYICQHCKTQLDEWSGRCPGCSKWNTLTFDLQGICKI
ncbi:MAG: tetratricopeptide repeat protein [Nitrospirae bacterium]|nr:tetratricopeptide repeat protein [Nitrospirota bacterium]